LEITPQHERFLDGGAKRCGKIRRPGLRAGALKKRTQPSAIRMRRAKLGGTWGGEVVMAKVFYGGNDFPAGLGGPGDEKWKDTLEKKKVDTIGGEKRVRLKQEAGNRSANR